MPKWNGGVIGVANNPTQSSAKGIWSLSEATKAIRAGLWPPSNAGADPYFENVTLLLPGNGTNGAQNNTFLDSSTNNFTITRNGNTTQGTFTPFSKPDGRWSNYFDGTGDNLTSTHPALNATFTIEAWIYRTSGSANQSIVHLNNGGVSGVIVYLDGSNYLVCTDGVNGQSAFSNLTVPINAWTHVAVVRSGGTTTGYVNGTVAGSHSFTPATVSAANIGAYNGSLYFPGYISNVRVVNGSAVYTAAFTPSTSPITAITNTSLLTCQSNRFIDNSTNAFAITRNGDVSVQTFSPFPTLTAYAAGTNGGSGYFDGTADYLVTPSSSNLAVGTGDFCVEMWLYTPASAATQNLYVNANSSVGGDTGLGIFLTSTTAVRLASWNTAFLQTGTGVIVANQWNHIAVCRSGTTASIFVNGTRQATGTVSNNFSSTSAFTIGSAVSPGDYLTGYISSLRTVKGSSVYDPTQTTLTLPTAPLTAITNTSLLLSGTNGGIIDTSMFSNLETVGNAQISTTQSKFGGASMYFDGTGDYLLARRTPDWTLSGDFTIEFWLYYTAHGNYGGLVSCANSDTNNAPTAGWCVVFYSTTDKLYFEAQGGVGIQTTNTIPTSQWNHIAVVRSGSTITHYLNGTSNGSGTSSATYTPGTTDPLVIGSNRGFNSTVTGYIDDLRITKGYARYTANFTAPVGPFNGFGD